MVNPVVDGATGNGEPQVALCANEGGGTFVLLFHGTRRQVLKPIARTIVCRDAGPQPYHSIKGTLCLYTTLKPVGPYRRKTNTKPSRLNGDVGSLANVKPRVAAGIS